MLTACDRVNLIQDGVIGLDKPTAETSVEELTEIVVEEYRRARLEAHLGEGGNGTSAPAQAPPPQAAETTTSAPPDAAAGEGSDAGTDGPQATGTQPDA